MDLDLGRVKTLAMNNPTLDFAHRGACRDLPNEMFFPDRGDPVDFGKAVCEECPVKYPCAAWALRHEEFGMWGTLSGRARRDLRVSLRIPFTDPLGIRMSPGPCGTPEGYKRHRRAGELACAHCRYAHARSRYTTKETRR